MYCEGKTACDLSELHDDVATAPREDSSADGYPVLSKEMWLTKRKTLLNRRRDFHLQHSCVNIRDAVIFKFSPFDLLHTDSVFQELV